MFLYVPYVCSIYQILVLEIIPGEPFEDVNKDPITRYYHNKRKGEPYITAEFEAENFSQYKVFTIGNGNEFLTARRRRKRSGIGNGVTIRLKSGFMSFLRIQQQYRYCSGIIIKTKDLSTFSPSVVKNF